MEADVAGLSAVSNRSRIPERKSLLSHQDCDSLREPPGGRQSFTSIVILVASIRLPWEREEV